MRKRNSRLLTFGLCVCLTATSFAPVYAAGTAPAAAVQTENSVDTVQVQGDLEADGNMLAEIVADGDVSDDTQMGQSGVTDMPETSETPGAPEESENPDISDDDVNGDAVEGEPSPSETPEASETQQPEETVVPEADGNTDVPAEAAETETNVPTATVDGETYSNITWEMTPDDEFVLQYVDDKGEYVDLTGKKGKIITIDYYPVGGQKLTRKYTLDENGILRSGLIKISGKEYFFTTAKYSKLNSGSSNIKHTPTNSTLGSMVTPSKAGFQQIDTYRWIYLNKDGSRVAKSAGKYKIGSKYYYLDKNGNAFRDDLKKINGVYYAFNKKGIMVTNDFYKYKKSNKYYYFGSNGKKAEYKNCFKKLKGAFWHFDKVTARDKTTGFYDLKDGGKKYTFYFKSGIMQTGLKVIGGYRYNFASNGHMVKGRKKVNGSYYYFRTSKGSSGEPVGSAVSGWHKLSGSWYYYSKSTQKGAISTGNKPTKIGKHYFHFDKNGVLKDGKWDTKNAKGQQIRYYFQKLSVVGKPQLAYRVENTWLKVGSNWYYAKEDGSLAAGWLKITNKAGRSITNGWYYFSKSNYRMQKNKEITRPTTSGSVKGWLDADGRFVTKGWIKMNSNWKYFKDGKFIQKGWATIGGYRYYFQNGALCQDLRNYYNKSYHKGNFFKLEVNRKTCTVTVLAASSSNEWKTPVVAFRCSVGLSGTPTPTGNYHAWRPGDLVGGKWKLLMGPSWGQYAMGIVNGILFHSVSGSATNSYAIAAADYNRLGNPASHGCVRLCVSDAKWIFEHCQGSQVEIFDKAVDRTKFDKPTLPRLPASQNWDPTDPAIKGSKPSEHRNPYKK